MVHLHGPYIKVERLSQVKLQKIESRKVQVVEKRLVGVPQRRISKVKGQNILSPALRTRDGGQGIKAGE